MIARLHLLLPFSVWIPEGSTFGLFQYDEGDCAVTVYPPLRSSEPHPYAPDAVEIDGAPAFSANALQIDFQKSTFDRSEKTDCDPPKELIAKTINAFLDRLRYVIQATHVRPVNFPNGTWRLAYLDDSGAELTPEKGLVRARVSRQFHIQFAGLNAQIWQNIHELPPDYAIPSWESLRLDAIAAFPHVGTAIVLAASALEVYVETVLHPIAERKGIPPRLWEWIWEDQGKKRMDPSVNDQFDVFLLVMTGHSLKEESVLWQSFQNLKEARNKFVHEGRATIGGHPISDAKALELVHRVGEIIGKVESWIPEDLRTVRLENKIQISIRKTIFRAEPEPPQDGSPKQLPATD